MRKTINNLTALFVLSVVSFFSYAEELHLYADAGLKAPLEKIVENLNMILVTR